MSKKLKFMCFLLCFCLAGVSACSSNTALDENLKNDETLIELSDEKILVNNQEVNGSHGVSASHDMIYYEEGKDEAYGEGSFDDAHSALEAEKHTVVKISEPGTYRVSGQLSYGQLFIDLGEKAKENPNAVVNLILDNVDLTNTVSSAIVVLNAYECADEEAKSDVNTENAGFNLILADDSQNTVNGSHLAKIYKEGTTDKLYKFDGAIESYVSMNIDGESKDNGQLNLFADREGIETTMHMTINGGMITIQSHDDALNASEDGMSVITINNGTITCLSTAGSEGDGIDSNGWIVMNGGTVTAVANPSSMDSGVDSDNGIILNGGTLLASGNMYDEISMDSTQNYVLMSLNEAANKNDILALKDSTENILAAFKLPENASILVYSSPEVDGEETYELVSADEIQADLTGYLYSNITELINPIPVEYDNDPHSPFNKPKPQGSFPIEDKPEPPAEFKPKDKPHQEKQDYEPIS